MRQEKFVDNSTYPNNAQASWRWTMQLVDDIAENPSIMSVEDLENGRDWSSINKALIVRDFMRMIREAKFIFWDLEIFNAALNGSESFVGERFNVSDWSPTYYTYNRMQKGIYDENHVGFGMLMMPITLESGINTVVPIGLNGVVTHKRDGIDIVDRFALEMIGQVKEGDIITENNIVAQQLSAASAFLKMKVAAKEKTRLPRPERRRMAREGKKEPELYTVSLRKTQGKAENAGTGELIERDSHWMVSGHWRRQWFPSVEKHAPLWIDGHIKGDTTKPFKASKKRVFAAVR